LQEQRINQTESAYHPVDLGEDGGHHVRAVPASARHRHGHGRIRKRCRGLIQEWRQVMDAEALTLGPGKAPRAWSGAAFGSLHWQ
jgi:hypothetical protein